MTATFFIAGGKTAATLFFTYFVMIGMAHVKNLRWQIEQHLSKLHLPRHQLDWSLRTWWNDRKILYTYRAALCLSLSASIAMVIVVILLDTGQLSTWT